MSATKKKKNLFDNLFGGERRRHQVAMITEESTWNQHESNSGMARVFVVMLLVHVVLIGSIIVYDFIGTDDGQPAAPKVAGPITPASNELTPVKDAVPAAAPVHAEATSTAPVKTEIVSDGEYRVESGDNIKLIAAKLGVSVADLVALNKLDDAAVEMKSQTVLKVPANKIAPPAQVAAIRNAPAKAVAKSAPAAESNVLPVESAPPAVSPEPALQVVSLADTPPPAVTPAAAAPVKTTPPPPQPKPQVASTPAPTKPAAVTAASGPRSHTMSKGDTLYSLSRKYGVSISALQKANNITNPNAIREGTKLTIPAK